MEVDMIAGKKIKSKGIKKHRVESRATHMERKKAMKRAAKSGY